MDENMSFYFLEHKTKFGQFFQDQIELKFIFFGKSGHFFNMIYNYNIINYT
jgi:hypothetical protein